MDDSRVSLEMSPLLRVCVPDLLVLHVDLVVLVRQWLLRKRSVDLHDSTFWPAGEEAKACSGSEDRNTKDMRPGTSAQKNTSSTIHRHVGRTVQLELVLITVLLKVFSSPLQISSYAGDPVAMDIGRLQLQFRDGQVDAITWRYRTRLQQ
jgi:hypothetical protein